MAIFGGSVIQSAGGVYTYPINQSLRFEDGSSAYLSRTPASAGNRKTWTWSGWVKRGNLTTDFRHLFAAGATGNTQTVVRFESSDVLRVYIYNVSIVADLITTQVFRDASAWYHIVVAVDTTQATASDRIKIYINGEQVTSFSTETYPSQNLEGYINSNSHLHTIGRISYSASFYHDGYMAEVNFIDGQALGPENFGETDDTWGIWKPIEYTGSYGTNGFYLDFSNGSAIGEDSSGNSNDWTANNLAATDIMLDSPTNNFAVLNPLNYTNITLSEGNLKHYNTGNYGHVPSTFGMSSGKWYAEFSAISGPQAVVGINAISQGLTSHSNTTRIVYIAPSGETLYDLTTIASSLPTFSSTDVMGVALDVDAGTLKFYKNNTLATTITNISSYHNVTEWAFLVGVAAGDTTIANFGQDSSFAGNKTAQNNTDDNGYGDFYYSPPSGFLALCSANLPEAAVIPSENFNTVLYTGDGTASHAITGVGFQPDLVYIRTRNTSRSPVLYDNVRGVTLRLRTDDTAAETDLGGDTLLSFDSDGFTYGADTTGNGNGDSFVAWNWKADNTSGSSNTDGSITSTVAANPDAGFSIVSYTGADNAGDTVGHGLSQAPEMIIVKRRNLDREWAVYHNGVAADAETDYLVLNSTAVAVDNVAYWNDTAPTSSVFSLSTSPSTNNLGDSYIAYCFHSVPGYSKFGSYTGNSSADGTFVYTGFKPAFVLLKRTNLAVNWFMFDNKREGYNVDNDALSPNTNTGESTDDYLDLVSNGFKFRSTAGQTNSGNFIYMAFASSPFKYSTAR